MQVLTWARNLAILYKQPSGDIIKSVKTKMEYTDLYIHADVHVHWISFVCTMM